MAFQRQIQVQKQTGGLSEGARAYKHVFEAEPLFKIRYGHELLPKVADFELRVMKRGFCVFVYGAPGGKTGEGKTWAVETFAQAVCPWGFTAADVVYTIHDFLARARWHRERGERGSVVVLDESQNSMPASSWFTRWNKLIANSVALSRKFGMIFVFIAPLYTWPDKKVRSLIRYGGYAVLTFNRKTGAVEGRLFLARFRTDTDMDNVYRPMFHAYDERLGQVVTVQGFFLYRPTRDVREPIDDKELEFKVAETDSNEEESRTQDEEDEAAESGKGFDPEEFYEDVIDHPEARKLLDSKGKISAPELGGIKPFNNMPERKIGRLARYVNRRFTGERERDITAALNDVGGPGDG